MFPISSKRRLSFSDIADFWSREIAPPATPIELLNLLGKAWWRGDLITASGGNRVDVLRALYCCCSDRVAFASPEWPEPSSTKELADGSLEIILWRVALPNSKPDTWNVSNCAEAFNQVAEAWNSDVFDVIAPIVAGLELIESEFRSWVTANGYQHPTFWESSDQSEQPSTPVRRLTEPGAVKLVQEYINSQRQAGRRPTQDGLEKEARKAGYVGGRDILRQAFKRAARHDGIEVRPGRYPKNPRGIRQN